MHKNEARQSAGTPQPKMPDSWFRQKAIEFYHEEGVIEIDDNATVSRAENNQGQGAYVQAWVWISSHSDREPRKSNDQSI